MLEKFLHELRTRARAMNNEYGRADLAAGPIAGLPPAAGGVTVADALVSTQPGIRTLKKIAVTANLPNRGGRVPLDLPKSSYFRKGVVRVTGTLRVVQGGAAQTITATDPRKFLQQIVFALSGSTSPRVLTGVQEDIIDNLDVPAISANKQTYTAGPAGAASSTTDTPLALEWSLRMTVSDQNLYGIPYLGAIGTVPQIVLTFADPDGNLAVKGAAGPTITVEGGLVELSMWRVDLPGPVMPSRRQEVQNGNTVVVEIPGQGLYIESSWILLTRMFDAEDLTAAGTRKMFRLPIGPDYTRIILLAWKGNVLDDETAPLVDNASLIIQQATALETKKIWEFDNEYRQTYMKNRPTGVYVFSGIDLTGTDADLYVSRDLGNFDLEVVSTNNAVPANSRYEVITQELLPLSAPGVYL